MLNWPPTERSGKRQQALALQMEPFQLDLRRLEGGGEGGEGMQGTNALGCNADSCRPQHSKKKKTAPTCSVFTCCILNSTLGYTFQDTCLPACCTSGPVPTCSVDTLATMVGVCPPETTLLSRSSVTKMARSPGVWSVTNSEADLGEIAKPLSTLKPASEIAKGS